MTTVIGAGRYEFSLGDLRCVAISDATEVVTPANIASIASGASEDELADAVRPYADPSGSGVVYDFNVLYVEGAGQRVLIDAGWGRGRQRLSGLLLDRLGEAGVAPSDVDTVILTHGDADHVGGLVTAGGDLSFPNADYALPSEAWDFWTNAARVAKWPPFLTAFAREALPLIRERTRAVADGEEIRPGFQFVLASGHRPGHAGVAIASQGERLLHLADVVGHSALLAHPTWAWPSDFAPERSLVNKLDLLGRAVADGALVFGSHLAFPGVGRLACDGAGWRLLPLA